MNRLFAEVYPRLQQAEKTDGPLGLRHGQVRQSPLFPASGWFNGQAAYLGLGDLSIDDLQKVIRELQGKERFIIVPREHFDIRQVYHPTDRSPGLGVLFIVTFATLIAVPGRGYIASQASGVGSLPLTAVTRDQMVWLITTGTLGPNAD